MHKLGAQNDAGSRKNIGFRYNLFHHLGLSSTLRAQKQDGFPICYEQLVSPVVFEVEAYDPQQCSHEDIWPCNVDYGKTSKLWKGPNIIDFRAMGIDVDVEGAKSNNEGNQNEKYINLKKRGVLRSKAT